MNEITRTNVNVDEIVHEAWNTCKASAQEKNIEFVYDETATEWALDKNSFSEVLTLLFNNAIKHSPDGGRVVTSVKVADDRFTVLVKDGGEGMAEGTLSNISQAGAHLMKVTGVIEAHGGELEVDSIEGLGTTFTISIPK